MHTSRDRSISEEEMKRCQLLQKTEF